MMTPRLLFLGASAFQLPAIEYARSQGYYTLTCDNRLDNPGHRLVHESYHISSIDNEKVLDLAEAKNISGVIAFASDASAPTAAYVAEKLGLPTNGYTVINTMANKNLFRQHLQETNFQPHDFCTFKCTEKKQAHSYLKNQLQKQPQVVKPVFGSGSRGVSIVTKADQAQTAIENAVNESIKDQIIIEAFIQKKGHQICGDGYIERGELQLIEYGDGHVPSGGFLAPCAETFPSCHAQADLTKLTSKIKAVLHSLNYNTGPFNIDAIITESGEPFLFEIGPRSGGNFIPRAIELRTGVNLVAACVEAAYDPHYQLALQQPQTQSTHPYVACYMLHSLTQGSLQSVEFSDQLKQLIYEHHPYLSEGQNVNIFNKGSAAIGNLILTFPDNESMQRLITNMPKHYQVKLLPTATEHTCSQTNTHLTEPT